MGWMKELIFEERGPSACDIISCNIMIYRTYEGPRKTARAMCTEFQIKGGENPEKEWKKS